MRSCWFFVNYFADCSFRIKWWVIQIVQARLWTRAARQGWVSWRCVAWWCVKRTWLSFTRDGSVSFFFFFLSLSKKKKLQVNWTSRLLNASEYIIMTWLFELNHDCVSKLGKVLQSEWDKRGGRGGRRRALYPLSPCTRYLSTIGCGPLDNKRSSESIDWIWWIIQRTYICRVNKAKNR